MSKTNLQVYLHIVFSTKSKQLLIEESMEYGLYGIMWETIKEKGCFPIAINGMPDHVHILLKMDSKIALANLLKFVKVRSSKHLNENYSFLKRFEWQRGYGAFSINQKEVDKVMSYIKNQKQHHRNKEFYDDFEI